jgi:putative nucleotidyltransferase-like protein
VSSQGLHPVLRPYAVRNLLIDRLTAEVAGAFAAEGIETLVLKGPVLAEWLYPGDVRPYGDSDLMVAPERWEQAVGVLGRLGFADHLAPLAHPRMESHASTAFLRGADNLDLHCMLHGLEGDPEAVWGALIAGAATQIIGGAELCVPGRAALLLHIGLHAAHHAEGKALEDLRRAIAQVDGQIWREAVALGRTHDGLPAFASGLRLLPEGVQLAGRLGIEDVRSIRHDLRHTEVPLAEGIDALLRPGLDARERLAIVGRELLPRPEFMRWWTPLARRGSLGLLASYPWRWGWLAAHAPRALAAVARARTGRGSKQDPGKQTSLDKHL